MADKITLRGDTKANWESVNPVLSEREMVIETDTRKLKIGDGVKTYTQLRYATDGSGYKSIIAKISQSGSSTFSLTVFENTLGVVNCIINSTGYFSITSSGLFKNNKSFCSIFGKTNSWSTKIDYSFSEESVLDILTTSVSESAGVISETLANGLIDEMYIEIRVYD